MTLPVLLLVGASCCLKGQHKNITVRSAVKQGSSLQLVRAASEKGQPQPCWAVCITNQVVGHSRWLINKVPLLLEAAS